MIIKKEVKIKNRRMLKAAIAQTQQKRNEQLELLSHNASAVQSKWTLQRLVTSAVSDSAPSLFGGVMMYVASLFGNGKDSRDSEHGAFNDWKTIILEFIKGVGVKYFARQAEPVVE